MSTETPTTIELVPRAGKRGRQVIDFMGTGWLVANWGDVRGLDIEHQAPGWVLGVADAVKLPTGGWANGMQVALPAVADEAQS
jgi:hypothetical protein